MRILIALCAAFAVATPAWAQHRLEANELSFQHLFGTHAGENATYCPLGVGFFTIMRSDNADEVAARWLMGHPHAKVIPVSKSQMNGNFGSLYYVWIVDGEDFLNIELVRRGAVPGGTMADPKLYFGSLTGVRTEAPPRLVSDMEFDRFMKTVFQAQELAQKEKVGIWADRYKEERENSGIK